MALVVGWINKYRQMFHVRKGRRVAKFNDVEALVNQEGTIRRLGLIVEQCPDGSVRANVPRVQYHSTGGFSCGYSGSGPADLALSVLHALIEPPTIEAEEAVWQLDGRDLELALADAGRFSTTIGSPSTRINKLTWLLHQHFKETFISKMPQEGGYVPIAVIENWIVEQRQRLQAISGG